MVDQRPEMPIDRLRAGTMLDDEVIAVAAEIVRKHRIHDDGQDLFNLLAKRLEQVKLPREDER